MKFKAKYDIRNRQKRKMMIKASWSPVARDFRDIIEDYVRISRKRKGNKLAISTLQIHLFHDLITYQKILDEYKKSLDDLKKKLKVNKNEEKYLEMNIFTYEKVIKSLKDIADGMAYRYLNYDRALLYYLAEKPEKGPLRPHEGIISEMTVWSEAFDCGRGSIALMNDLTNVLRIGDVTIFNEGGEIEFVEVKSGKSKRGKERKARLIRQQNRLKETVEFFNTGISKLDNQLLRILKLPIKAKHNFSLLRDSLEGAKSKGFSSVLIEEYLLLECADFEIDYSSKKRRDYFNKNAKPITEGWSSNKDFIFGPKFIHERLDSPHNLVPFSIWPFDSATCADLMMGRLMFCVTINISEIERKLEKKGWVVEKSIFNLKGKEKESKKPTSLMSIKKGGFHVEVPPGLFAKMFFEFLSPDTLIETFDWLHNNIQEGSTDLALLSYEKEDEIWD